MKKITPFLWFDNQAEEAAKFYMSVFKNSKLLQVSRYGEAGPGPKGSVMVVAFEINGQEFLALNGGPLFKFNESVSFVVPCETQEEIDEYWEKLSAGGQKGQCGWLKDRYGLSWQVAPANIGEMLQGDRARADRIMKAVMQMTKIDLAKLQKEYTG
ncbi:MAG TPA: VOC family protein [Xanthobacteraceae bacterium]|nr:VOC family protein [Xanthobacteraceae bacterium]